MSAPSAPSDAHTPGSPSAAPAGSTDAAPALLTDGSRVAVIGGGPAGAFFAYFLLDMAERTGVRLEVDIFEPRDFNAPAPQGCNMCGGIISESLVQALAAEGINLPSTVIQRGIDAYELHTDAGRVRIETPVHEMRIGAVHRGGGPRDIKEAKWGSFDAFLLDLALGRGARHSAERVDRARWENSRPEIAVRGGEFRTYELLAVAAGVNSGALKLFRELDLGYEPPRATKTFIREYYLGEEEVEKSLGNSMHVFLLDIPRLEFAAVIPKGDYATVCLLGHDIDNDLVQRFLDTPQVRECFPADWNLAERSCQCAPRISVLGSPRPYADRVLFIGDSGVTRLYKDGIGAAYRTAKAAAAAAVFEGISADSFRRRFWPACRTIRNDNRIGKLTFAATRIIQHNRLARRAVLRMARREQGWDGRRRRLSMVLWDLFTGSAPYREIFIRTLHPAFLLRLLWDILASTVTSSTSTTSRERHVQG